MIQKIFLIGLPGAGKTFIGKRLAAEIDFPFIDLDDEIVKSEGKSIPEIFEKSGEDYFRKLEKDQLNKVIQENNQFILAAGGGTPCFFDNMDIMNDNGVTVFINTSIEEIQERLKDDETRPLMKNNSLEELLQKRKPWYERAHHTVSSYAQIRNLIT